MRRRPAYLTAAFTALAVALSVGSADAAKIEPWAPPPLPAGDALVQHAVSTLDGWAAWLAANNVRGYVGEVGWPRDDARWSAVAHAWYERAEGYQLPVTTWVTGEWAGGHQLANFVRSAETGWKWTTTLSSDVMEAHPGTPTAPHGVNVTGPEMGTPAIDPTSSFSNKSVGIFGQTYIYDGAYTFDFLAAHGVEIVRIPFRWERLQQSLFGELDPVELGRLQGEVRAAGASGLQVVLDMHNFGGYYLHDGTQGVRRGLGSAELPISAFTDAWRRLAVAFANEPAIVAFDLMNEPVQMPSTATQTPAQVWEDASQQAVRTIRATGERRVIAVGGYGWSGMKHWALHHPVAWIKDPAKNIVYEAHQYWNSNNSGVYLDYDYELAFAAAR